MIVCASLVTAKLCDTGAAALTVTLPGCSARTVQMPAATIVIVAPLVPPAVQTLGVVVVNDTGSSDVEVATTPTGVWLMATLVTGRTCRLARLGDTKGLEHGWRGIVGRVAGLVGPDRACPRR